MASLNLEALFADYRRTGDPGLLARVFDEAAPRLLLVASHLARDRAEAEDLVQATFVAAIEDAASYDAERPLLPWLCGILARRARAGQRRAQRAIDPERLAPRAADDPATHAEQRDLTDQVLHAIEGLPPLYRHVLVLHLVHQLQAVQIARSLGRSPETVRTQLRRGLQMLRGSLPAGLGVAMVVPSLLRATQGRGLDAIRTAVLEHAPPLVATGTAAATTAGLGGLLLMKTTTLAALGTAALATLALVWSGAFAPTPHAPQTTAEVVDREPIDAVATDPVAEVRAAQSRPVARAEFAPRDTGTSTSRTIAFTGRCVDATTSAPLSRCTVVLTGRGAHLFATVQLASVTTGADGTFAATLRALPPGPVTLRATAPDRAPTAAIYPDLEPGPVDVGDVPMHFGARCHGTVVDESGNPVPGVELFAMVTDEQFAGHNRRSEQHVTTSQHDGSFVFRHDPVLPRGSWELETTPDRAIVRPRRLAVEEHDRVITPTIVVRAKTSAESISGVVRNVHGDPLAEASVTIYPHEESTQTRADGTFVLFRPEAAAAEVQLTIDGPRDTVDQRVGPIAWGRSDLEITLQPALLPRILVVDARTGAAIEKYSLATRWSNDINGGTWGPSQYPGEHEGGTTEIERVGASGSLLVVVMPADPKYKVATTATIDLSTAGGAPTRIAIAHRRKITFRVHSAGAAVADSRVEILRPQHPGTTDTATSVLTLRNALFSLTPQGWRMSYGIDRGETGADGRVTLHAADDQPLALRVTGPTHAPVVVDPLRLPDNDDEIAIEVLRGATLTGRFARPLRGEDWTHLVPSSGSDLPLIGLVLRQAGEQTVALPGLGRSFPVAADGTFEISNIPAGRYDLVLMWWRHVNATMRRTEYLAPPLATVSLRAGATEHLDVALTTQLPGRLLGRITHRGRALADAHVTLAARDAGDERDVEDGVGGFRTDRDGRFVGAALPAGEYLVSVRAADPAGGDPLRFTAGEWITIVAGQDARREIAVDRRSVEVRLIGADGEPLPARAISVVDEARYRHWHGRTDAEGRFRIANATIGPIRVRVHDESAKLLEPDTAYDTVATLPGADHFATVEAGSGEQTLEFNVD